MNLFCYTGMIKANLCLDSIELCPNCLVYGPENFVTDLFESEHITINNPIMMVIIYSLDSELLTTNNLIMMVNIDSLNSDYLATNNPIMTVMLESTVSIDLSNLYEKMADGIYQPIVSIRVFNYMGTDQTYCTK